MVYYYDLRDEVEIVYRKSDNNKNDSHIKAWNYLYLILKRDFDVDLNDYEIKTNENGKPYIENEDIHFNIAHSHNLICIVVSRLNCSIDCEFVNRNKDINKLAAYTMTPKEFERYLIEKDQAKYFYMTWVKKECITKYKGSSIFREMENINYTRVDIQEYNMKDELYIVGIVERQC